MTALETTSSETIWKAQVDGDKGVLFRVGRAGDTLVAEWPGLALLRASRSGASCDLRFAEGTDPRWRRKVERGLVRGMLAQLRGELTLHASAIAKNERAVLLLGASGQGKSTLAAALAMRDATLLCDDASPVVFDERRVYVEPSDDEVWLWTDARRATGFTTEAERSKAPVVLRSNAVAKARIVAIAVLRFGEGKPRLRALRGSEMLPPLLAAIVRLVVDEPAVQVQEIATLERLVERSAVVELSRPRDLGLLDQSVALVERLLDGDDP